MRLRLVTRIRFQYWTPILGALGKPNQISEVTHLGNLFGALLRSQGPLPHHCKPNPIQSNQSNPFQSNPIRSNQSNPIQSNQSNPIHSNPIQSIQSNPIQSIPINPIQSNQSNPIQSNPINPIQSNPIQSQSIQSNPIQSTEFPAIFLRYIAIFLCYTAIFLSDTAIFLRYIAILMWYIVRLTSNHHETYQIPSVENKSTTNKRQILRRFSQYHSRSHRPKGFGEEEPFPGVKGVLPTHPNFNPSWNGSNDHRFRSN